MYSEIDTLKKEKKRKKTYSRQVCSSLSLAESDAKNKKPEKKGENLFFFDVKKKRVQF